MVNINLEDIPTADARWIDVVEAARMMRPLLRKTFPGVKFSVRIDRYSMGASIGIVWTDGPTREQVEDFTRGFQSGRFNGQTDCSYSADSWFCAGHGPRVARTYGSDQERDNGLQASRCCGDAELVHFGSSHVSTRRALSPKFAAQVLTHVLDNAGLPADTAMDAELPDRSFYWYGDYSTVRDGVYRASLKMVGPTQEAKRK